MNSRNVERGYTGSKSSGKEGLGEIRGGDEAEETVKVGVKGRERNLENLSVRARQGERERGDSEVKEKE